MKKERIVWFDHDKCIQCHGCEVACRSWRDLPYGLRYRRVLNVLKGEYPHVKSHSVSLGCLHCVQPECLSACPETAIYKSEADGLVLVEQERCTGCGTCVDACPYQIPQIGPDNVMEKCNLCTGQPGQESSPPCVMTCPGSALSLKLVTAKEKECHQKTIQALIDS